MNRLLLGFRVLKDHLNQRITGDMIGRVDDAYKKTLAEHKRMVDLMLALFVFKTTKFKFKFKSPIAARLQPLDELGRARPVKAFAEYEVGLPIQSAGIASGRTRIEKIKSTVQDANDLLDIMLDADITWLRDHILAALFNPNAYEVDDPEHGKLNVNPLANNDATRYFVRRGSWDGAQAQHFIAQAGAIADNANIIKTAIDKIKLRPENSGRVIVLVSSTLTASIKNLADFVEKGDADIAPAAGERTLVGAEPTNVLGEVVGKTSGGWVIEWDGLPADYFVALSEDGPRPLAMREHPESELQGFTYIGERQDIPYFERQYDRHAGFGAYNRVAAVAGLVGTGAYETPAGYELPMP